jgi:hypothetical protein
MDNIVNDYSMEFEPLTEMVLDKSIAYFQTLKDELVTIKNRSGKEIYDIFQIMESIIKNKSLEWDEKYNLIFSKNISIELSKLLDDFSYYDPDSGYEDDVLAYYRAVKDKIKMD